MRTLTRHNLALTPTIGGYVATLNGQTLLFRRDLATKTPGRRTPISWRVLHRYGDIIATAPTLGECVSRALAALSAAATPPDHGGYVVRLHAQPPASPRVRYLARRPTLAEALAYRDGYAHAAHERGCAFDWHAGSARLTDNDAVTWHFDITPLTIERR